MSSWLKVNKFTQFFEGTSKFNQFIKELQQEKGPGYVTRLNSFGLMSDFFGM